MNPRILLLACLFILVAGLSGCSFRDAHEEFDACTVERIRAGVEKSQRWDFMRACMGSKGFQMTASTACQDLSEVGVFMPECFRRRGFIGDAQKLLRL